MTFASRIMKKRSPLNLRGLQVFEAVARHRSITKAAEELNITQSAVSHQLRALRELNDDPLIEKRGRQIELTKAGRELALTLDAAFDLIEHSVGNEKRGRAVLRVGVYSSFATSWFIKALPDFLDRNPEIDVRVVMLYDPHEISPRIADIFITSEPTEIGYDAIRLFPEIMVPVVRGDDDTKDDSPRPLITAEVEPPLAGRDWEAFAVINKRSISSLKKGDWICCSHYILSLEMVKAGLGAALLPDFMAGPLITNGNLRRMSGAVLPTGQAYSLQLKFERRRDQEITAFLEWIRDSALNVSDM